MAAETNHAGGDMQVLYVAGVIGSGIQYSPRWRRSYWLIGFLV